MRIRHIFIILAILLLAIGGTVLVLTFSVNPKLFYITEGLMAILAIYLVFFYIKVIKPLGQLTNGIKFLRQQDNMSRLRKTGQPDVDEVIDDINMIFRSQVQQAEKSAYEKVIRMIAHEVNNSVAAVCATMTDDDPVRQRMMSLSSFVSRFAGVVKIPLPQMMLEDLSETVEASALLMENLCSSNNIRLNINTTDEAVPVRLDATLFQQVLVNIIKNAVESIVEMKGMASKEYEGEITITVENKTLTIANNGRRITQNIEKQLFSPFFTTKPQGQGIGLLLIRDILQKHHCTYSLHTYPDNITRFVIVFPQ